MSNTVSRAPHRKRQFWIDHVQAWQHSGLSKAAYCEQHNLKPGSFYNWSSKTGSMTRSEDHCAPIDSPESASMQFQPIKLTNADSSIKQFVHVECAATDIALPTDLTPEQIHHWLSAIHQLHV